MDWNTEPVLFFFFGHFVFFPRARVGLVKKSDEKHRKKSTWPYIARLIFQTPTTNTILCLLLLNSKGWEFLFDLGDSQLVFPPEIAVTTQRPDIVIFSRSKKAVLLVELTVPLEDCVAAGHTRKENRYAGLVQQCTENGWFASCFAVEVGCLGYVSPSLLHCLESLGIPSSTSCKLRNECSHVTHWCSYVLFLRRNCVDCTSWSMGWPSSSTFLKLALVLLSVLIWQLASLLCCIFPCRKLALPCPLPQQYLLCVHLCFLLRFCLPSPRWSLSRLDLNPHAQSRIFSQCACIFHRRMTVACVHTRTRSHSISWLKLKVLVAKGALGFARGLTSSDALICCQDHFVILMVDETDLAQGLLRSWWRIEDLVL